MSRILAVLLACLVAVAPGADAVCEAACTPAPAAAPSCHEAMTAPSPDGALASTNTCRRDVDLAVPPGDTRRSSPAPTAVVVTGTASPAVELTAVGGSAFGRATRARPAQAFPRCIVLRI